MTRAIVLDQSSTTTGFAVVEDCAKPEISQGVTGKLFSHGVITTKEAKTDLLARINIIRADLDRLINKYKPDNLVLEETRYINQKSGKTAHASSAAFLVCEELSKKHNPEHIP